MLVQWKGGHYLSQVTAEALPDLSAFCCLLFAPKFHLVLLSISLQSYLLLILLLPVSRLPCVLSLGWL